MLVGLLNLDERRNREAWVLAKWEAQFQFVSGTDKSGFEGLQRELNKPFYWEDNRSKLTKEDIKLLRERTKPS